MEPETYFKRLLALWLALPVAGANAWLAMSRLPDRVVTKVDGHGKAVAWASREGATGTLLGVLTFVLLMVTLVGWLVGSVRPDRSLPALALLYVVVAAVTGMLMWMTWGGAAAG